MSRNPQILFDSILSSGDIYFQTNAAPASAEDAISPFTYEAGRYNIFPGIRLATFGWSSTSGEPEVVNSVGLLIRGDYFTQINDLTGVQSPVRGQVRVYGSNEPFLGWEHIYTYELLRSGVNYFSFPDASYLNYQIRIEVSDEFPDVGDFPGIQISLQNIMLGRRLEFERPLIRTHDPLPLNRVTEYQTNVSGNGQFLGRSISRRGVSTSVDIPMMSREFARGPFQNFVKHAQKFPYYFSWNETAHPGDVGYVWTDEDIKTGYSGDGSLMSASWSMRGF